MGTCYELFYHSVYVYLAISDWFVTVPVLYAGKVHGSLARAGKVRGQTPKVAKQDKKKKPRGRAHKRMQYNRRFVTAGKLIAPPSFPVFVIIFRI
jgi:small subunit ribosomal protein S30e